MPHAMRWRFTDTQPSNTPASRTLLSRRQWLSRRAPSGRPRRPGRRPSVAARSPQSSAPTGSRRCRACASSAPMSVAQDGRSAATARGRVRGVKACGVGRGCGAHGEAAVVDLGDEQRLLLLGAFVAVGLLLSLQLSQTVSPEPLRWTLLTDETRWVSFVLCSDLRD